MGGKWRPGANSIGQSVRICLIRKSSPKFGNASLPTYQERMVATWSAVLDVPRDQIEDIPRCQ